MEERENIELRSEKVRHLIGEIPPGIVRYGILVITLIVVGLMAGAYFIPYPELVNGRAVALDSSHIEVDIPYKYVNVLKNGMKASVEFEGYDAEQYGYIDAIIVRMDETPVIYEEGNRFVVSLYVKGGMYQIEKGMKGTSTVFIAHESVLKRMWHGIAGAL